MSPPKLRVRSRGWQKIRLVHTPPFLLRRGLVQDLPTYLQNSTYKGGKSIFENQDYLNREFLSFYMDFKATKKF